MANLINMKFDASFELEWKQKLSIENQNVPFSWTAVGKIKQPLIKCSVVPQSFGRELLPSSQLKHHHLTEVCLVSSGLMSNVCSWFFRVTYPEKLCLFIFISFSHSSAPTCWFSYPCRQDPKSPPEQCLGQHHGYSSNKHLTEYN